MSPRPLKIHPSANLPSITILPDCESSERGRRGCLGNPTVVYCTRHATESLSFSYNAIDQLTGMTGSVAESYGSYVQAGSFDIGNLLQKGSATLTYPGGGQARPHAPTSVSTLGTFTYDANGNRQADPSGNTYAYDAENRLTNVTGSVSLQNTFDGDGARLIRTANGTSTSSVGDWYEVTNGVATVYYPFNGLPIAMKQGATLSYLHHDHLGSLAAVSNAGGQAVGSARYWPFGGLRTSTGSLPTDRGYTGQIRDGSASMADFAAARDQVRLLHIVVDRQGFESEDRSPLATGTRSEVGVDEADRIRYPEAQRLDEEFPVPDRFDPHQIARCQVNLLADVPRNGAMPPSQNLGQRHSRVLHTCIRCYVAKLLLSIK
jgi:hypothetical protein